jgi:predicted permease
LDFLSIFLYVVLPVLLMVGFGAGLQRIHPLDIPTLSKLNIYLFVPAFLFVNIVNSQLTWGQMGGIVGAVALATLVAGVPIFFALRAAKASGNTLAAVVVGGLVFNAGNFGIPVTELLYISNKVAFKGMQSTSDGPAVQALVVMCSNLTIWCFGYMLIALLKGGGMRGAMGYFKLPMVYVLIAAFVVKYFDLTVWKPVMEALHYTALGIIPVALITLGAQLAQRARLPHLRIVGPVVIVKLIAFPAVMLLVVWLLGLWPWPGVQLVIAAAAPTAVNTLLITLELDGDADLAAECVFWTTVCSAVTVTLIIGAMIMWVGVG